LPSSLDIALSDFFPFDWFKYQLASRLVAEIDVLLKLSADSHNWNNRMCICGLEGAIQANYHYWWQLYLTSIEGNTKLLL
jgi:hypothetical protein